MRKQTLSKTGRTARNLRPSGNSIFAHQRDQSFCPRTPSFSLCLPRKDLEGPTYGISIEERPACHPSQLNGSGHCRETGREQQDVPCRSHQLHHERRTRTWTYPVRAPRTRHSGHRDNFTNPHFTFPVHEHSFIHSHACIHTFISYIQASHIQLLHYNASRRVMKR